MDGGMGDWMEGGTDGRIGREPLMVVLELSTRRSRIIVFAKMQVPVVPS